MKRILLLLLWMAPLPLFASAVEAGHDFYEIETEFFEIVFPEDGYDAAITLSNFADECYEEVLSLLSRKAFPQKITVVISSDFETANGSNLPIPYNRIFIYLCPPEPDGVLGMSENPFYSLFRHELTHALSLTLRPAFLEPFAKIFGNFWLPQMVVQPWFMIEGVTTGTEGTNELSGRVHNPFVEQQLSQDALSGNFKSISQSSGGYDLYPGGSIYYFYGGYFTDYLIQNYGESNYAELWNEMGKINAISRSFKGIYGFPLREAWSDFEASLTPEEEFSTNENILTEDPVHIWAGVSDGESFYYYDSMSHEIRKVDSDLNEEVILFHIVNVTDMDVSDDGKKLLLSYLQTDANSFQSYAKIYNLEEEKFESQKYEDIWEASFFGNGIVGIGKDSTHTVIVSINEDGVRSNLLFGTDTLLFGDPQAIDTNRIVFLMSDSGVRSIALYNLKEENLRIYTANELVTNSYNYIPTMDMLRDINHNLMVDTYEIEMESFTVSNINDFSLSEDGKIAFSYSLNNGFTHLGLIDGKDLYLQTNHLFGSVRAPEISGDRIFYTGNFSDGNRLLFLNKNSFQESAKTATVDMVFSAAEFGSAAENLLPSDLKKYNPLKTLFLKPMWWPSLAITGEDFFDSFGATFYMNDALDRNTLQTTLRFVTTEPFLDGSVSWANSKTAFPFSVTLSDSLSYSTRLSNRYRVSFAYAGVSRTFRQYPRAMLESVSLSAMYARYADAQSNIAAYQWQKRDEYLGISLSGGLSALVAKQDYYDYSGAAFSAFLDYNASTNLPMLSAQLSFSPGFLKLTGVIAASYCPEAIFTPSGQENLFSVQRYTDFNEFSGVTNLSTYAATLKLQLLLGKIEIQTGPAAFPLYFNRLSFFMGYRSGLFGGDYYQTAYLRANLEMRIYHQIPMEFQLEGYYAAETGEWGYRILLPDVLGAATSLMGRENATLMADDTFENWMEN